MAHLSSVWSEEHDCIPLKQRLKMLLASNHLSDLCDSKDEEEIRRPPFDIFVKKEDNHNDSQGFHSACHAWEGRSERASLEHSHQGRVSSTDDSSLQHGVLSNYPVKLEVKCTENNSVTALGSCLDGSSNSDVSMITINSEIPEDFLDDLDHIVLKERQRMLLARKLAGSTKLATKGNLSGSSTDVDDMILQNAAIGKEESDIGGKESSMGGNDIYEISDGNASSAVCEALGSASSNDVVAGVSSRIPPSPALGLQGQGTIPTESGVIKNVNGDTRLCSFSKRFAEDNSYREKSLLSSNCKAVLHSDLPSLANIKVEPLDSNELQIPRTNGIGNSCLDNLVSVKSELENSAEPFGDIIDHMLLGERRKLMAHRNAPNSNIHKHIESPRKIVPPSPNCTPVLSEPSKPLRMKQPWKRRKTVTDSVETALEEDAPGLLQVLIEKGVLVDEIKLYGETESDDALDESLIEESFSELEDVILKLFSQRQSFLKFAPIKCPKGEKASYCLACLISLVEQARYLQFRKWPVEWGWCRDLQSFIFVFERHNRLVLERPEYGYATYFFELVDSLPVHWQIKRLVTAMKLTSCSRITLIENRALVVGDDLTEGEARVLMEYGWIPDSGLGTMLNYRDRVVHDRKNEMDSPEWRSKIGKLLVDGYNGGTIVSNDIPKKFMEYGVAQTLQIKLEQ